MAFVATKIRDVVMGGLRGEVYACTELGTDTGGVITTGLRPLQAIVNITAGTVVAIAALVAGQTITISHAAGPTALQVTILGDT